jgi:cupin 2 domain-containing protein
LVTIVMSIVIKNIFAGIEKVSGAEDFATVLENPAVRIERIVSHSHPSPEGFWYDQSGTEWVMVLRGEASLEFADGERVEMKEGDYLTIPSHVKHRVCHTGPETVWLAVHFK